ncbi:MAG: hypothetical protein ACYTGQ_12570, partial [Planctomycetota bacterium]
GPAHREGAIEAYKAFIQGRDYGLPEGERADQVSYRLGKSPRQLKATWTVEARERLSELGGT